MWWPYWNSKKFVEVRPRKHLWRSNKNNPINLIVVIVRNFRLERFLSKEFSMEDMGP